MMPKKTSHNKPKRKITAISVQGYKSLGKEVKIEIAPLTILSGVNSSGKTSFFQPFLMLKQTQEAAYNPNGVLVNGPNLSIHETSRILSEIKRGERVKRLKLGFYFSDQSYLKNSYGKNKESSFDLQSVEIKLPHSTKITLTSNTTLKSIKSLFKKDFLDFIDNFKNDLRPCIIKTRGFLSVDFKLRGRTSSFGITGGDYKERLDICRNFINFLHIPGIRGNPERNYNFTSTKARYVGRFEDYTASIIYNWKNSSVEQDKLNAKTLALLLRRLGLTTSISAQKIGDVFVALEVGVLPVAKSSKLSPINIADVGFGVSQVLPILVALIEAKKNQVVYIEQPELHLHPRAQSALAEIFVEFSKQGKMVILETHSSIILRRIQTLIAQNEISNDEVSFNWFSMGKDGLTHVDIAKLDKKGRYGNWPQDFDDVYLDVETKYIESALL